MSLDYGFTGVSFFFILSGFVLTWSHGAGDRAGKFYWNRFARVWPLHALTTFLAVLVPPLASTTTIWPALPFVLTLTQSWFPGGGFVTAFNGVSWSLSCEAFFYLLFPLLIKGLRNHRRPGFVAGALFTAMAGVGIAVSVSVPGPVAGYLLGWLPLYRLGEFALGICLALLIKNGWRPRFTLGHAVGLTGFLYASLLAASLITSGTPGSVPVTHADLTMMPGFLAMIAAAAASDLKHKASSLSSNTIVRLGNGHSRSTWFTNWSSAWSGHSWTGHRPGPCSSRPRLSLQPLYFSPEHYTNWWKDPLSAGSGRGEPSGERVSDRIKVRHCPSRPVPFRALRQRFFPYPAVKL